MDSSCEPGSCGAYGHCSDGQCLCMRFHLGESCQFDFISMVGTAPWTALVVIATCLHGVGVIAAAWRYISRGLDTGVFCAKFGPRDAAAWMNFIGSVLRILWFAGLTSGWDTGSRVVDGLLLRLPQAAWVGAYLCIVLVWRDIMASASGREPRRCHVWAVGVAIACVTLSTGGITIADGVTGGGFGGHPELREAGDAVFTTFVVLLAAIGAYAANRLRRLAMSLREGVRDLTSHDDQVRALMVLNRLHQAFRMTMLSVSAAWVLVICVVIVAASGTTPQGSPQSYLAYMFVIHCIVEPSAVFVLLVVTQQDRLPRRTAGRTSASVITSASTAKSHRSARSEAERGLLLPHNHAPSYSS